MTRKKILRVLLINGVVSLTILSSCIGKEMSEGPGAAPVTVADLLASHNVMTSPEVTAVFIAEAKRTVSFPGSPTGNFTRLVTLGRDHQLFRYERVDPLGPTKQIDVFDGYAVHHAMAAKGRLIEQSQRPGDSTSEAAGAEIRTFGLLPILGRLIEAKSESIYDGRTAQGLTKLQVTVSGRVWTVNADSERLIRRLEFQDSVIEYDDYREIEGIRLPLRQRFFLRGQLYYELSFVNIELKPKFASGHFSRETMVTEVVR